MAEHEHIETERAVAQRRGRQRQATPGGLHDGVIRTLAILLPMGVGIVIAFLVIAPLTPRSEVSFLLDRNKVDVIEERLRVDTAMYRGADKTGRPFSLTADEAVQRSSVEGIVRLKDVVGRILLDDGPAQILANGGAYTIDEEVLDVDGPIQLRAADGYSLTARGVSVDLREQVLLGSDGVEGEVPAGTFSADSLRIEIEERRIVLDGRARLRMVPGELRSIE